MERLPSRRECIIGDCQMARRCFAIGELVSDADYTTGCSSYLPPADLPNYQKTGHKRKLIDE